MTKMKKKYILVLIEIILGKKNRKIVTITYIKL